MEHYFIILMNNLLGIFHIFYSVLYIISNLDAGGTVDK